MAKSKKSKEKTTSTTPSTTPTPSPASAATPSPITPVGVGTICASILGELIPYPIKVAPALQEWRKWNLDRVVGLCRTCGVIVPEEQKLTHLIEHHIKVPSEAEKQSQTSYITKTVRQFLTDTCLVSAVTNRLRRCIGLTMQLWEATSDLERMMQECRGDPDSDYDGISSAIDFMTHGCDDPDGRDVSNEELVDGIRSYFE